jgi:hypothetical protein
MLRTNVVSRLNLNEEEASRPVYSPALVAGWLLAGWLLERRRAWWSDSCEQTNSFPWLLVQKRMLHIAGWQPPPTMFLAFLLLLPQHGLDILARS